MTKRKPPAAAPHAEPSVVTAYIKAAYEPAGPRLGALRDVIRRAAPDAVERIAYGLATRHQDENLIHLGAFKHHIGVYPGAAAIVEFGDDLAAFKTSKGAFQIPHDAALPLELVARLTRWRLTQAALRHATKEATRRSPAQPRAAQATRLPDDIVAYHTAQTEARRAPRWVGAGPWPRRPRLRWL
jgi:uncharacterized protein YdhG (YjbR/CyaY superfamily)